MTTDNRTNGPTEAQVEAAFEEGMDAIDWGMVRNGEGDPQEAAGIAVRAALVAAQGAAPVLPSSTVDEDALAEVIGSLGWGYKVDGPSMGEIARAVVEWMKGQGR